MTDGCTVYFTLGVFGLPGYRTSNRLTLMWQTECLHGYRKNLKMT
jgi:hypothetical protein